MAYIDDLLGRDEKVLYIGRQHIFILIGNILAELSLIVIMVAAGMASQIAFQNSRQGTVANMPIGQMVLIVCLVISLVILASAIIDYLRWVSTEFVITNHRVIRLRGVVNKESADSSLDKINDLELRQSWLGRMFDFGDVEILTASDTGANVLQKIAHPLDFKRAMNDAKQQYIHGFGYYDPHEIDPYVAAPGAAPAAGGDLEHTLSTLADLRDRGVLSNEEFELKKRELLSRI